MAYTIVSTCIACDLCIPACPIDAISVIESKYVIDQDLCCDFADCLVVCPVNAILPTDVVQAQSEPAGVGGQYPSERL